MKLNYALLVAFVALLWGIVHQFVPDFPLEETVFKSVVLGFVVYILGKLGVEIVGQPIRKFFSKK